MRVVVLTADYAQTDDRAKVNAMGLGWGTVGTPLPAHGIAIFVESDWHESNEQRSFIIELLDEDGHPVVLGEDTSPVVRIEGEFEVGRPPGLAKGTPLMSTFAINFPPGMPLAPGRRYEYRCTVGAVEGSASFSVNQQLL